MNDQTRVSREVVHYSTKRLTYVVVDDFCVKILDLAGSVIPNHPMLGARLEGSVTSLNFTRLRFQEDLITWFTDPVTEIVRYAERNDAARTDSQAFAP